MTRILHVISGLGTGGAETMLVQLTSALKARGFDQHVVCLSVRGPNADEIEKRGVPVTALGVASLAAAPAAVICLCRAVRSFKPDVIQGWMYHGDLFATLAHLFSPGRARRLFWNIRASNTDLGGYGNMLRISAMLSRIPDVVLANSQAGLDFHIAKGYRPRRPVVVPNGFDTSKFKPDVDTRRAVRKEFGIAENAVVAIHVARADPMKDHASFVQAMRLLPQVRAIMAGTGTEGLDVPANVLALGVRKDVARLFAASDIVVSSSVFAEGFSNILAEGMSTGLVPVTTDIGDARLIVGDVGYIVRLRDPQALVKAIGHIAALPEAERRERGLAARARILDRFTLEKAVNRFAGLYSGIESPPSAG